jgi:hypothetical protein
MLRGTTGIIASLQLNLMVGSIAIPDTYKLKDSSFLSPKKILNF